MEYRKIVYGVVVAMVLICSCNKNKFDQPVLGLLDAPRLANKSGVEGLLIGAYALLDGQSSDDQGFVGGYGSPASNWIYGSVCGSEAHSGSDQNDGGLPPFIAIERFDPGTNNPLLLDKWSAVYAGVQRANTVLRIMRMAKDIKPADTVQIRAEALFLRAHYHFEAKKMWNNIPFIDESVTYAAGNYHVANDTSWQPIENDFIYAVEHLPATQNTVGRANQYAAKAFLAKVYMFENKFPEAKILLQDLIANGHTAGNLPYALEGNYGDNFNPEFKNGPEAVFSVQNSVNDGAAGGNGNLGDILNFPFNGGPGGCCGFFQPSQWLVNHFKTDPITGLPDLDHFNDMNVTNDEGYESDSLFTPYTGTLDPRLDLTLGRRGIPYLDWGPHPGKIWIRRQDYMGPYAPKKNVYYESQLGHLTDPGLGWSTGAVANNVNLIRFADVLLWAAEVEVEIGSLDQARAYVNHVRGRVANPDGWVKNDDNDHYAIQVTNSQAGFDSVDDPAFTDIQPFNWVVRKDLNQTWVLIKINPGGTKIWNSYAVPQYKIGLYTTAWSDKDFARKAVRFERVLELAMEGHRFFDLVRWGVAEQEINTYLQKEMVPRQYLKGATFISPTNEYFPIPKTQIDLSSGADGVPLMIQNPGY